MSEASSVVRFVCRYTTRAFSFQSGSEMEKFPHCGAKGVVGLELLNDLLPGRAFFAFAWRV